MAVLRGKKLLNKPVKSVKCLPKSFLASALIILHIIHLSYTKLQIDYSLFGHTFFSFTYLPQLRISPLLSIFSRTSLSTQSPGLTMADIYINSICFSICYLPFRSYFSYHFQQMPFHTLSKKSLPHLNPQPISLLYTLSVSCLIPSQFLGHFSIISYLCLCIICTTIASHTGFHLLQFVIFTISSLSSCQFTGNSHLLVWDT